MNKKIKRIIAITLSLTAFFAASPTKYLRFIDSNIAYASSDDDEEEKDAIKNSYLSDIELSEGDINFSEKKTEYTVKIDSDNNSITITATGKNSTDKIKIDGSDVSLDGNNKAAKVVELNKGRNMIKIKVETEDYGIRTYNLVVNRGSASDSDSSSSEDSDGVYLDSIVLSDGSISFSREKMMYDINVNASVDQIRIAAQPESDNYDVKIDGVSTDKDESYRRAVNLVNGKNIILIELEDSDGNEQTYTLNVYRGGNTASNTNTSEVIDNTQDPIYLDDIVIEDGSIPLKFKPKVTSYAVDVKDIYDNIVIKSEPEYDDVVRINGSKCEDKYIKRVELKEGKNVIEIKVNNSNTYDKNDDDYEERIYTLTVYRGTSEGTVQSTQATTSEGNAQGSSNSSNSSSTAKINQWINNNGKWQYDDSTGNLLKNVWYYDKNYGKNYYLDNEGNMATGWVAYNNSWYYLDGNGTMVTGWKQLGSDWYYLYETGVMAKNTTIDGYKLNSSGALKS